MEQIILNLFFIVNGIMMIIFMGYCTYKLNINRAEDCASYNIIKRI